MERLKTENQELTNHILEQLLLASSSSLEDKNWKPRQVLVTKKPRIIIQSQSGLGHTLYMLPLQCKSQYTSMISGGITV